MLGVSFNFVQTAEFCRGSGKSEIFTIFVIVAQRCRLSPHCGRGDLVGFHISSTVFGPMSSLSEKMYESGTDGPFFMSDSTLFLVQKVLA